LVLCGKRSPLGREAAAKVARRLCRGRRDSRAPHAGAFVRGRSWRGGLWLRAMAGAAWSLSWVEWLCAAGAALGRGATPRVRAARAVASGGEPVELVRGGLRQVPCG